MKRFKSVLLFLSLSMVIGLNAESPTQEIPVDNFCTIRNTSFAPGEELNFTVYYSLFGIYVNAGNANPPP